MFQLQPNKLKLCWRRLSSMALSSCAIGILAVEHRLEQVQQQQQLDPKRLSHSRLERSLLWLWDKKNTTSCQEARLSQETTTMRDKELVSYRPMAVPSRAEYPGHVIF